MSVSAALNHHSTANDVKQNCGQAVDDPVTSIEMSDDESSVDQVNVQFTSRHAAAHVMFMHMYVNAAMFRALCCIFRTPMKVHWMTITMSLWFSLKTTQRAKAVMRTKCRNSVVS